MPSPRFEKGNKLFFGRKHSEETKKRISQSRIGIKPSEETRKKLILSHTGKKLSEETKKKMSETRKGRPSPMLGKKQTRETREKISQALMGMFVGKKGSGWRGGVSTENEIFRHSVEFRLWRESVFARDNWTCQKCFARGDKLHPHHIKNFSKWKTLRFAIDNGITFCETCHRLFHKIYGMENNTKKQLKEFVEGGNK